MSFSRGAERLKISQPPLSQQIKILEDELGCLLFDRSRRSIELTTSGAVLLREAKYLLARHDAVARLVSQASVSGETVVSMGFINSALVGLAPAIVSWTREHMPFVHPELKHIQSGAQFDEIAQDRLDVGFLRVSEAPREFRRIDLPREVLWLAVPASHRLADREAIAFEELANENVVLYARHLAPAEFDNIVGQSERHGFGLRVTQEVQSGATLLPYVAAGEGVALVPRLATRQRLEGVLYKPIDPPVFAAQLAIVARFDETNPVIREVVQGSMRIASDVLRSLAPSARV